MTETLSLIAVVVMALLLWRERRKRVEEHARGKSWMQKWAQVTMERDELAREHLRLTDRDEKGRFVKREKGRAV